MNRYNCRSSTNITLYLVQCRYNHYNTLGINPRSTDREIRKSYLELTKQWHPDVHRDKSASQVSAATKKFTAINEAYSVLTDSAKKREYDNQMGVNRTSHGSHGSHGSHNSYNNSHSNSYESYHSYASAYNSFYEDIFGSRGSNNHANSSSSRGQNGAWGEYYTWDFDYSNYDGRSSDYYEKVYEQMRNSRHSKNSRKKANKHKNQQQSQNKRDQSQHSQQNQQNQQNQQSHQNTSNSSKNGNNKRQESKDSKDSKQSRQGRQARSRRDEFAQEGPYWNQSIWQEIVDSYGDPTGQQVKGRKDYSTRASQTFESSGSAASAASAASAGSASDSDDEFDDFYVKPEGREYDLDGEEFDFVYDSDMEDFYDEYDYYNYHDRRNRRKSRKNRKKAAKRRKYEKRDDYYDEYDFAFDATQNGRHRDDNNFNFEGKEAPRRWQTNGMGGFGGFDGLDGLDGFDGFDASNANEAKKNGYQSKWTDFDNSKFWSFVSKHQAQQAEQKAQNAQKSQKNRNKKKHDRDAESSDDDEFDPQHAQQFKKAKYAQKSGKNRKSWIQSDDAEERAKFARSTKSSVGDETQSSQRKDIKPQDVHLELNLTFLESCLGCKRELEYKRNEVCYHCNGIKTEPNVRPTKCLKCDPVATTHGRNANCSNCGGTGLVYTQCQECRGTGTRLNSPKRLVVTVPSGVRDGDMIRVASQGHCRNDGTGRAWRKLGDVYITCSVAGQDGQGSESTKKEASEGNEGSEGNEFYRKGSDIHVNVEIPMIVSIFGGSFMVPTIYGEHLVHVLPGTVTGDYQVLRGKGVKDECSKLSKNVGNQFCHFEVSLPRYENLTDKQLKLLQDFYAIEMNKHEVGAKKKLQNMVNVSRPRNESVVVENVKHFQKYGKNMDSVDLDSFGKNFNMCSSAFYESVRKTPQDKDDAGTETKRNKKNVGAGMEAMHEMDVVDAEDVEDAEDDETEFVDEMNEADGMKDMEEVDASGDLEEGEESDGSPNDFELKFGGVIDNNDVEGRYEIGRQVGVDSDSDSDSEDDW